MIENNNLDILEMMSKEELLDFVKKVIGGGITLSFNGKRTAQVIERKVMPRIVRTDKKLNFNINKNKANNIIIDGENLQAMVTLYKYRGLIDIIVTDPPYNTGKDFRYNDKWDTDPNDPDLGNLVTLEDGSRHTKWMKFMLPRIQMMKAMLKPNGVLAICIDEKEFFHIGMMLNEIFGEENRIGIINWQKTYSPKNDTSHISSATEYILVYSKDKSSTKTGLLPRNEEANSKYRNPDNDIDVWTSGDLQAKDFSNSTFFGIQSPFTGKMFYPDANKHWRFKKSEIKTMLELYNVEYTEIKDPNSISSSKSLVIKGTKVIKGELVTPENVLNKAIKATYSRVKINPLPRLIFLKNGLGVPRIKRYLKDVKKGMVPLTYWANEEYEEIFELGNQSWEHSESGHSQTGVNELDYILGKGHNFETVKPLKLIEKIIQLWCPPNGKVLDPFAGSGTTGHAVLSLNNKTGSERSFILIEKGENEDKYAETLTRERIKRVITGERVDADDNLVELEEEIDSGFEYWVLDKKVDADAILTMKRDELIDVVITSHWEDDKKKSTSIIKRIEKGYKYLVGKNILNEGFFIVWNGKDAVGELNQTTYMELLVEAKNECVTTPYHVYARYQIYQTSKVEFYQIPDKILMHLGLNENSDRYNNEGE